MFKLSGSQRKHLRSMAHHYKPVVMIGKNGVTPALIEAVKHALEEHELIKIKFIDFKDERNELTDNILKETDAAIIGRIGNTAILYKQNPDPEKRIVPLPNR